ncbi:hypothetical protein L2E82_04704 [Cichorium intybus]|uniref:Uncharacterized protein n=1 Tax=Cichorium intybus TaxID=13427 RepID=A0ACB9H5T9_CICIN|nr:hypothetical protein L2E82_04704 [Cichorium intybus]
MLKSLEDLDYTLKGYFMDSWVVLVRCEGVLKTEDTLTGLKVIEYEGKRISFSLRTYIPETEMAEQNHEYFWMIFLNDVYIGDIVDTAKSLTFLKSLILIHLKLLSLKPSTQSSKELTFSFLCQAEEMVNLLDVKVCQIFVHLWMQLKKFSSKECVYNSNLVVPSTTEILLTLI